MILPADSHSRPPCVLRRDPAFPNWPDRDRMVPIGDAWEGVGLALAAERAASLFDQPGLRLVDRRVFVAGDEGSVGPDAMAAAARAGRAAAARLAFVIGAAPGSSLASAFAGLGFRVDAVRADGLAAAIARFRRESERPTLIALEDGAAGEPWRIHAEAGVALRASWEARLRECGRAAPERAAALHRFEARLLPDGWDAPAGPSVATGGNDAVAAAAEVVRRRVPWFVDANALAGGAPPAAIASAALGLAEGKLRPCVTVAARELPAIADAIRASAERRLPVLWVATGGAEDAAPALSGVVPLRPCDAAEVDAAFRIALARPDAPALLRVPDRLLPARRGVAGDSGARVLAGESGADVALLASGPAAVRSALAATALLAARHVRARVVSVFAPALVAASGRARRDRLAGGPGVPVLDLSREPETSGDSIARAALSISRRSALDRGATDRFDRSRLMEIDAALGRIAGARRAPCEPPRDDFSSRAGPARGRAIPAAPCAPGGDAS